MQSPFELVTPKTLDEAIAVLEECGHKARVLAGGTDLLVQIHTGAAKPECLIDLKGIEELKGVRETPGGGLEMGALTTHAELEASPQAKIQERLRMVAEEKPDALVGLMNGWLREDDRR